MNKFVQSIFAILFPLYPIWAWFTYTFTKKPIEFFATILFLPIALYYVLYINKRLPKYLIFFLLFTVYHLCSVYVNDTFPRETSKFYFFLTDYNILACLFFIVIEYTKFSEEFIRKMSRNILLLVVVSLVVSLVQIQVPTFFFNTSTDEDLLYVGESRNFSIYSWTNLNSAGITFPILISILVSRYDKNKWLLPLIILCGIVVSFLTRARYVMVSAFLVISQLFLNPQRSLMKRISAFALFIMFFALIVVAAWQGGYDLEEVVNTRILEKDSDMASAKARVLSYDVFMVVFPEAPWLGVGPETKQDVIDLLGGEAPIIHVGYLSYLYFYGVVGCLFFFLFLFFVVRYAWIVARKDNFWGSFYGLFAFCLANWSFVYFNCSEMGIVLSLVYLKYYHDARRAKLESETETVLPETKKLGRHEHSLNII